jgi:hypothetical protein
MLARLDGGSSASAQCLLQLHLLFGGFRGALLL